MTVDDLRARVANVVRCHQLMNGRCETCGEHAIFQSLHQADMLMALAGVAIIEVPEGMYVSLKWDRDAVIAATDTPAQ